MSSWATLFRLTGSGWRSTIASCAQPILLESRSCGRPAAGLTFSPLPIQSFNDSRQTTALLDEKTQSQLRSLFAEMRHPVNLLMFTQAKGGALECAMCSETRTLVEEMGH